MQRLLIVADNSFAAQSIRLALRQTAGFQVVGLIDATRPITERIAEYQPDVVLIDDPRDPRQPAARIQELATHVPDAKRIFLTMRMDDETVSEILDAGADAIVAKTVNRVSLATLLRELVNGTIVQRPRAAAKPATTDCPLTERDKVFQLRLVRKAGYFEIRRMHAQQQPRFFVDRLLIICKPRPVRCSHFTQNCAAVLHDLGNAKTVADFDKFPARDNHFSASGKCRKGDQHCCGAIVHHDRGFRTGQPR